MRRIAAVLACLLLTGCGGSGSDSGDSAERTPAHRTPAPRTDVAAVAARADVPVLCYHQIREPTSADGAQARPYIVAPGVLAKQMEALDKAGYTTVTGDQVAAHVARGAKLPAKPVLLTFDDASAGQYTAALPILRRHDFVATFFVMTVVLDKEGWLTRKQVRALARDGMTIGAHTWDHSPVPRYAGADWAKQVDAPVRELRELTGQPVKLFAYPFGEWDAAAIPHLWSAGLTAAFQLGEPLDRRHPLWNLRRIIVPDWSGPRLLQAIKSSF
jgi:peptidoglycan/xylan/chitin deacetylase (PgdA/CDA1 family)